MAEEKLGTLQYEMEISEVKLKASLETIDKLLKDQDVKWKAALSNVGGGAIDVSKAVAAIQTVGKASEAAIAANKRLADSNFTTASSYEELKAEIKEETDAQLKLNAAQKAAPENKEALLQLQKKIDLYAKFRESLNEETKLRKQEDSDAKKKAINDEREIERLKRLALERSKLMAAAKILPAGSVERSSAYSKVLQYDLKTTEDPAQIQRINQALNTQDAIRKRLTTSIKDQAKAEILRERTAKAQLAVDAQAEGSIGRLRKQIALYLIQISGLSTKTEEGRNAISKLNQSIAANQQQIKNLQPTLGMWGKLISAIKTYATAYISVQAVMGLGRAVFNQTKELDSLNFSMQTVIKSSTELAQTQKFLSDVAVNYGGDLLTLSERYIKFRAAAVQSNMSAAETQKIFESVSKAAGTLGLKTDELSGVYLALEQMISKGKVTTEELRRQLGERLPGAFGIMANALGVTLPELDKLLKKGEVLTTDALPKFAAALEKAYGIESLTKIDTLAAAQGRMSTQFTGLIKAMEASGDFKNIINSMADFIGFVKDNISVIGLLAKAMLSVVLVTTIYRARIYAIAAAQFIATAAIGVTKIGTDQLSVSMLRTAMSINTATRSWKAFGVALASNWVGLLLTALSGVVAYMISFRKDTEETASAIQELNKEFTNTSNNVERYVSALKSSKKGSNEYKEALEGLNNIAIKYNDTLLTEKSSIDDVSGKRVTLLGLLDQEYNKRKQIIELEEATTRRDDVLTPIREEFYKAFEGVEGGAQMAGLAFAKFKDLAVSTNNTISYSAGVMAKETGLSYDKMYYYVEDARNAMNRFDSDMKKNAAYWESKDSKISTITFSSDDIAAAKKEFEEFEKLKKRGEEGLLDTTFVTEQSRTYKEWLENQIYFFKKVGDDTAVKELTLALVELDGAEKKSVNNSTKLLDQRNEAIKRLNDKYLADQEEFANFDMGIAAGRIAAMEDGIEKEVKLNELAYANRLKAIEKEKIKTLELLNEARDPKTKEITGFDATGYDAKTQKALLDARNADIQERLNAEQDRSAGQIRIEKDTQLKLKEIRRDAEDQFKTGIEKERAAIDEKYDDWVRKAKQAGDLVLAIELDLLRENAKDEMYRKSAIDRLDFEREIQYKKNEIAQDGSTNQRKLDRLNFETYAKFERQKIALLKADKSTLQQGLDAEEMLIQDEKLFKLKQEIELRGKIIDGIKQVTDELATQLGLSEAEAENLKDAVSLFSSAAKGDYLTAAITAFGLISESLKEFSDNKDESKAMIDFYTKLGEKISDIVNSVSLLNSTLSKIGDTSSIAGVRILQAEIIKLKNDAARLNEELQITSGSGTRRGDVSKEPNNADGGGSGQDRMRVIASMVSQVEYLNEQILILSNKLLDPNLTEAQRKSIEAVLNGYIDLVDAIDQSIQSITGTSVNELSNSIVDAFLNGEDAAVAWGEKVNDIIKYMIKQQLISQLLTKPITEAIQTLVTDSEGGLTAEEAAKFKATIKGITDDVAPAINDALSVLKDVGIDITGAGDIGGISKGIQALTEDTGRRLEGMLNSIRETSVINMGNTKQLVESSQAIQGYAAESLGHLRNIDITTANQLKFFNDMVGAAGVSGKSGLRVIIQ